MGYIGTKPANQIVDSTLIADGTVTPSDLSTGKPVWDTSGNVGIGTSPSSFKLDVRSDTPAFFSASNGDGTRYGFTNALPSNSGNCYVGWIPETVGTGGVNGDLGLVPRTSAGASIRFFTGSTSASERMRIDSSGNLLVGTTTSEGRITITGDACGNYIGAINNVNLSNCNPAHGLIFRAGFNGSASGSNFFSFRRPDNNVLGSISQNGASAISYNTSSDYRLKDNIAPMTGALATVAALKPVTYTWKEDGSEGQGFIAHELAEVVPDCVTGDKDAVDFEGNPVYQGIDTSFLVATLTAAIQEQQAIINELKSRIEVLETK